MSRRLRDILVRKVVYALKQAEIAGYLELHDSTLSRILNGTIDPNNIDKTLGHAFAATFPILDALLPMSDATQTFSLTAYPAEAAPTVLEMAKTALLARGITEKQRWTFLRNAAHAHMVMGAHYESADEDDEPENYRLIIAPEHLEEARGYFRELLTLRCIPLAFRTTLELAVQQNSLAIDMMIEKGTGGAIEPSSPTLRGFTQLFQRAVAMCPRDLPEERTESPAPALVMRTLTLYAGSAVAELRIESGQADRVKEVVDTLTHVFGADQRRSIQLVLHQMAWQHNQGAYAEIFDHQVKAPTCKSNVC